ncbi:zinc finger CCHC domain-containing protein 9-like isoform X2 [Patiria miniata]|uniref:CCHC-type domain-containing protein n=1 Tax=Patiria miniata TaxID=46514 RepID=A0A914AUA4_PATMI|nr:zinc finger CCHC domain-containing protein 9-like isoform X2 [Patiria miniata]
MTRYARGNKGNRKRPHEASSWSDLKTEDANHQQQKTKDNGDDTPKGKDQTSVKTSKRRKQKSKLRDKGISLDEHKSILKKPQKSKGDELQQEGTGSLHSSLSERLTSWSDAKSAEETERKLETDKKKDKRREERRLKRIKKKSNKMVCYHCREAGHGVADCPKMLLDEEQGTGICFRCGSTEHEASKCTAKVDPSKGDFPFAKCFICQETGHLSNSCPDNPRGLYPLGGSCKHCGSVEHRNQHCPHGLDAQKRKT